MKKNSTSEVFSKFCNLLIVLLLLAGFTSIHAQNPFVPATHVSGEYMYGNCSGNIKVKFLYQDRGFGGMNNIDFYYKTSSGGFVQFARANNTSNFTYDWFDGWGGTNKSYTLEGVNSSITFGSRKNDGNLSYQDFVWNTVPADAIVNGQVTIASGGSFNFSSWVYTSSSSASIPVLFPSLSPPSALTATNAVYCEKIKLDWAKPNSFPCSYSHEIYRNNVLLTTVSENTTSYEDAGAAQGNVQYTVKAVHTTGSGGKIISGSSFVANGAKKGILSAPSGITATDNRCDGKIALSWNYYNANPTNFEIQRSGSASGPFTFLTTVDGGERSYQDVAPTRSTNYFYKVGTTGDCGATFSNLNYLGNSPTIPTKPTNVSASVSGSSVVVTWTDNSFDETGFSVERTIQGASGSTTFLVGPGIQTYTDGDVSACVNYIYNVRARNNCDPTGSASLTSSTTRIYPNISNSFNTSTNKLKCSKGYYTNMVQLEWNTVNVDILNQYRVYRKTY
ncbi:MAG: hypothetical protein V4658_13895 [Bacteroidota bacterium]